MDADGDDTPMRPYGLILTLVALSPLTAFAQDGRRGRGPGTGPGGPNPGMRDGSGGGDGFRRFGGGIDWSNDDQKKWDAVKDKFQDFSKENTPNFYQSFDWNAFAGAMKPGGSPNWFQRRVAKRFIEIMDAKNSDPELFKIKVDLLKIEDSEFAKLRQMHEAKKANDTEKYDQLKAELQAQAPDYVKARLAERKHRLAQLERTIAEEKKKLEEDSAPERIAQMARKHADDLQSPHPPFRPREGDTNRDGAPATTTTTTTPSNTLATPTDK
jgi:hypothetical protein